MNFNDVVNKQKNYFASGATLPIDFRIEQLKKLQTLIQIHEADINTALKQDLHKAPMEAFISEIMIVNEEIDYIIKNLKKWAKPQKTSTPFPLLFPGSSYIYHDPYGCALIIAPWNYPFQLLMSPLIGAIAAGNCAIIKPSDMAINTADIITKIINDNFPSEFITSIEANAEQTNQLLQEKFDYIFFTGGTRVGQIVMEAAAKHLTPLTLELGGKSPCIIDQSTNLDYAARRIVWGKFMNAGQTCIAPDYLYVHQSCKNIFIEKLKETIKQFYTDNAKTNESYGRIINQKHFSRLENLMHAGKILFGGDINESELYISPTLIDGVNWNDPIMQEEIFGPLLPILSFDSINEVITMVNTHPKPLALYLFTNDKETESKVLNQISFGGGCVNDCVMHVANYHLPFGGVGASGLGAYHGKNSFETFSHSKGVYKKSWLYDIKLAYPPFSSRKMRWLKALLKI